MNKDLARRPLPRSHTYEFVCDSRFVIVHYVIKKKSFKGI